MRRSHPYRDHCVTNSPSRPDCEQCQLLKVRNGAEIPSGSSENWARIPLYRIHVDLVGPSTESIHKERFAFVSRHDFTGYVKCGCRAGAQAAMRRLWGVEVAPGHKLHCCRADNGWGVSSAFSTYV